MQSSINDNIKDNSLYLDFNFNNISVPKINIFVNDKILEKLCDTVCSLNLLIFCHFINHKLFRFKINIKTAND